MGELASGKRLLLATYLDYLCFVAFWEPFGWALRTEGVELGWAVRVGVFATLELIILQFSRLSPGRWGLGIVSGPDGSAVVEPIRATERWWTILLGTFLVLEGSKNLVRFTQGLPPLPVFSSAPDDQRTLVIMALVGAGNMVAGMLVLRCRSVGAVLGLGLGILETGLFLVSWPRLDDWIARRVAAQRSLEGLEIPPDEIETALTMMKTSALASALVGAIFLTAAYVVFRTRSEQSGRVPSS